ncbi:MAG: hypothetical protein AAGC60_18460 [Acidobacteriota bacterium]
MSPWIIFVVGVFVTFLCLFFVYATLSELREGARRADEAQARREALQQDSPG